MISDSYKNRFSEQTKIKKGHFAVCITMGIFLAVAMIGAPMLVDVAIAKPDFDGSTVGIECSGQWRAMDDHIKDGRAKGYTNMTPDELQTWKDEFKRLLILWNSFCGKTYGDYVLPLAVPGGSSVGGPLEEEIVDSVTRPTFPGTDAGGPQDGGVEQPTEPPALGTDAGGPQDGGVEQPTEPQPPTQGEDQGGPNPKDDFGGSQDGEAEQEDSGGGEDDGGVIL